MAKLLQIRRGNSNQHENFVGAAGEITMDTTAGAETIRVHNGETLGGIPLARADMTNIDLAGLARALTEFGFGGISGDSGGESTGGSDGGSGGGTTDLSGVPAEFWMDLFAAHNLRPVRFFDGAPIPLAGSSYVQQTFVLYGIVPDLSAVTGDCVFVCQSPDAGYLIGDVVYAFGIGNRTNPRPNISISGDYLSSRLLVGGESFWVSHKTDGTRVKIAPNKWKIRFRVWC